MRRARNGPGRNQSGGGRVDISKGFEPDSFDRVLLDAPCSALGLRPRLFAGEVEDLFIEIFPAFTWIYTHTLGSICMHLCKYR